MTRHETKQLTVPPLTSFSPQRSKSVMQAIEMKWITRELIRVNRTATCWLIRRFLDPEAEFIFVPADKVASMQTETGAIGF